MEKTEKDTSRIKDDVVKSNLRNEKNLTDNISRVNGRIEDEMRNNDTRLENTVREVNTKL